jgi:1-acyl-sn-glycerol-3-phosphate acyltransferase
MKVDRLFDFLVTTLCWVWFILGFFLFFSWFYLGAALFAKNKEVSFQRLNSRFYQVFFYLLRVTAPRHKWEIAKEVRAIRSAVIVCNHISYLDPLLLIALFERHRTIVKTRFFSMPVFGWIIRKSGYFPASGEGRFTKMMLAQMQTMESFFQDGGNLFVFPEGARSRDGRVGHLQKGALKIARLCKAPIYVLQLAQTDKLFPPGRFLFQSRLKNSITLKIIDRIEPDYQEETPSTAMLEQRLRDAYSARVP